MRHAYGSCPERPQAAPTATDLYLSSTAKSLVLFLVAIRARPELRILSIFAEYVRSKSKINQINCFQSGGNPLKGLALPTLPGFLEESAHCCGASCPSCTAIMRDQETLLLLALAKMSL